MVIVMTCVIGGFSWVHLIWLADVTLRLQPFTTIIETFEEIAMVMINNVTEIQIREQTSGLLRKKIP